MVLSDRLLAIANMITKGNVVVDIGTDHGYLPIYLIEQEFSKKAIAMDINVGPLSRAKSHINERGLSSYIDTRLSDGASSLRENEGDTLVIAGMGGNLVLKILSEGKRNISHIQEFVIQPQSEIASVREFLQENEYSIVGESMVMEEDKYYTIIKAVRGKMKSYEPVCKKYGKYLLENKDKVLFEYLLWEKKLLTNIMTDLIKNVTQNTIKRVSEIEDALALIEEAFLFYEKDI